MDVVAAAMTERVVTIDVGRPVVPVAMFEVVFAFRATGSAYRVSRTELRSTTRLRDDIRPPQLSKGLPGHGMLHALCGYLTNVPFALVLPQKHDLFKRSAQGLRPVFPARLLCENASICCRSFALGDADLNRHPRRFFDIHKAREPSRRANASDELKAVYS